MKITTLAGTPAVLRDDGSAIALDEVIEALASAIKQHGHFGNLAHHFAQGDWGAFSAALHQVLFARSAHEYLSPLARNIVRALSGAGTPSIRPFRLWFLNHLEAESSTLHRLAVERRIDSLNEAIRQSPPTWRKSPARILSGL